MIGLILAAGRGERVGGPKLFLAHPFEGALVPLGRAHVERSFAAGARKVVVVVHPHDLEAAVAILPKATTIVASHEDERTGPAGSIVAAIASGSFDGDDDDDDVIVGPVDVPPPSVARLRALLGALEGHRAARPRRGHPIAIRASVLRERHRHEATPLREVLSDLGADCAIVDLEGEPDLDTVDDVIAATGATPRFLRRPP